VGERGEVSRYAYWSDRAVQRVAEDMAISIDSSWRTKITGVKIPFLQIGFDLERSSRTLFRNEIADRIERVVGDHAVEDFVTPSPVRFAKGVGRFVFSHFICEERGRVVLHTSTVSSDGTRVGVALAMMILPGMFIRGDQDSVKISREQAATKRALWRLIRKGSL
jgi:hypothetical protein